MGRVRPLPVKQPGEKALQGGIVGGQHDQDQHNGVHQHAVVGELAQGLGQDSEGGGGNDGAPHVAQAAQHHEHQNQNGGIEVELGGGEGGLAAPVQGARRARQSGGAATSGSYTIPVHKHFVIFVRSRIS